MANIKSKKGVTKHNFPRRAEKVTDLLSRVEPILTPEKFRSRYMLGLPKVLPNGDVITDDILKDKIVRATNRAEIELGINIDPVQYTDRLPFDRNLYKNFMHFRTMKRPVISVENVAIWSANQEELFRVPLDWVDMGQAVNGQINVIPFLATYAQGEGMVTTISNAGYAYLATLEGHRWLPSYWNVTYTHGLCTHGGQIPIVVNDLIGTLAAIEILSLLGPTDPYTSASLSQDGISQSHGFAGIQRYKVRLDELTQERDRLISKLKALWNVKYFVSNF